MSRFIFIAGLVVFIGLSGGCGEQEENLELKIGKGGHLNLNKARWDQRNEPSLMDTLVGGQAYRYKFDTLPLSGTLSKKPWSGDYWPTYKGGITYRWNDRDSWGVERYGYTPSAYQDLVDKDLSFLSPAEKYDLMMGRFDYPLTYEERQRTKIMRTVPGSSEYRPGYKIPYWEGLCHAWAPATIGYQEPNPVTVLSPNGLEIPFGSSDIKALLSHFLHETPAKTQFLGMRCNIDVDELQKKYRNGEISWSYYMQQKKACADTNAGAFHLVLSNQVGLLDEGFIADVTRGAEVWNQAVYAYETQVLEEKQGASWKAAPGTVKEIRVHTRMYYTTEIPHSFERPSGQPTVFKDYNYWLEINKRGEIVGGEWKNSRANRPDFLWKQEIPDFWGDYSYLGDLYYQSIQASPNEQPTPPAEPGGPTEPTNPPTDSDVSTEPAEPISPREPSVPLEPEDSVAA